MSSPASVEQDQWASRNHELIFQNSIRHCLSHNAPFVNIDRSSVSGDGFDDTSGGGKGGGRGGYWTLAESVCRVIFNFQNHNHQLERTELMVRLMKSQDHLLHLHVDIDINLHLHLHLPIPLHLHLLHHLRPMREDYTGVLTPLLLLLLVQMHYKHHQPILPKDRRIPLPIIRFQPPLLSGQYIILESVRNHGHNPSLVKFTQNHIHTYVKMKILGENDRSEVALLARPSTRPLLDLLVLFDHMAPTAHMGHVGVI